jgi:hypothetical protein
MEELMGILFELLQILAIENDSLLSPIEKERRKRLCLYGLCEFPSVFEGFHGLKASFAAQFDIDNSISAGISSSILHPTSAPVNIPNSPLTNSLGELRNPSSLSGSSTKLLSGLLHSTKPVNIPSNNFSPSSHPNLFMQGENFMPMSGSAGSAPKINNNSFSHNDGLFMQHSSHLVSSLNEGLGSISPDLR